MNHPKQPHHGHEQDDHLRRDKRLSLTDGAACSLMVGAGETYFPAFALALGLGEVAAGLIATIPLLVGAILQLAAPRAVQWFGSCRTWCTLAASLQGLSFLPLIFASLHGGMSSVAVFVSVSLYWGAGLAVSPAWNTWIETLIPKSHRPGFFSNRTRLIQLASLAGFLIGGAALQWGKETNAALAAFAMVFGLAMISRLTSAMLLRLQREPIPLARHQRRVSWMEMMKRLRHGPDSKFLSYLLLVNISVQIAAPFFAPFMLAEMKLDYATYTWLIATAFAAKIAVLWFYGRFPHVYSAHKLLWWSGILIAPLAALWIVSQSIPYLLVVQTLSGAVWGTWEFATLLLIFDKIRNDERTSVLTMYNLGNAMAIVGGSMIGGMLLNGFGKTYTAYFIVFGVSACLRALTIIPLRSAASLSMTHGSTADDVRKATSATIRKSA